MSKNELYQVIPIGTGSNDETLSVQINKELIPALKHLSLFSHAIIFYREKSSTHVFQEVLKIISIDEKSGKCKFEKCRNKLQQLDLIDIKPYFPCEDRVLNAVSEISNQKAMYSYVTTDFTPCGKVKKIRGNTFIYFQNNEFLEKIKNSSHIKIYWWFDKFDKPLYRKTTLCNPPYENAPKTGVFASRSPVRPNPIALTTTKIINLDFANNLIQTASLDCFDNTPIISVVPYNPQADKIDNTHTPEWLKHWSTFLVEDDFSETKLTEIQISPLEQIKKYQAEKTIEKTEHHLQIKTSKASSKKAISVFGARQNNLKNINIEIPHNKISVVTGVSGSGKSSLVFNTIFAESQYRFFENTQSTQTSGLKQTGRPEFDAIYGLTPAIAVSQNNVNRNQRSTFGTITGIYNLLRSLYATIGIRHCPKCGQAIIPLSKDYITEILYNLKTNTKLSISAYDKTTNSMTLLSENSSEFYSTLKQAIHDCLKDGLGAIIVNINDEETICFQTTQKCYPCNYSFFELSPATFSFNNPESFCPVCNGSGYISELSPELIISNPDISILDGASSFWGNLRKFMKSPNANWMKGEVLALAQKMKIDLELAWNKQPEEFRNKALYGSQGEEVTFIYKNTNGRTGEITRPVEGAVNILKRLLNSGSGTERIEEQYTKSCLCPVCLGERLNKEGRLVTVSGKRLPEIVNMSVFNVKEWLESLLRTLNESEIVLTKTILTELYRLSGNFIKAGLSYITLNRNSSTLSGGELQRTRLVSQLISDITNVSYILDEPFTGLHHKDTERLFSIVKELKDNGNTVIMVEHNRHVINNTDYIIDIGPGAGSFGGEIVAVGSPQQIVKNPLSETGLFLSRKKSINITKNYIPDNKKIINLKGARANNLKNIDISFPAGAIVCISGVSGSGKSSLVEECLYPAIKSAITGNKLNEQKFDNITGVEDFKKIIFVDQKPIGRNSRSNPATYTGIMDEIRNVFANTELAKQKKFKANNFSFNSKDGQCQECNGEGIKRLNISYISETEVECPCCKGLQFNKETLEVEYQNKNIAEILKLSVDEAISFFDNNQKLQKILLTLHDIGLGYIKLGQNSSSVSGGEAQRIKLATYLCTLNNNKSFIILDEPSSGLHFSDVKNLMLILQKIVSQGNSVVMVEHNEDIINNCDIVIELGPEGGEKGGYLMNNSFCNPSVILT